MKTLTEGANLSRSKQCATMNVLSLALKWTSHEKHAHRAFKTGRNTHA